jgi:hypothetical protein
VLCSRLHPSLYTYLLWIIRLFNEAVELQGQQREAEALQAYQVPTYLSTIADTP